MTAPGFILASFTEKKKTLAENVSPNKLPVTVSKPPIPVNNSFKALAQEHDAEEAPPPPPPPHTQARSYSNDADQTARRTRVDRATGRGGRKSAS